MPCWVPVLSACSLAHDGVCWVRAAWLKPRSAEAACYRIGAVICSTKAGLSLRGSRTPTPPQGLGSVLESDALTDQLLARDDKRAGRMGGQRLDEHGLEEAGSRRLRQPAGIVAIRLVRRERLQALVFLPALNTLQTRRIQVPVPRAASVRVSRTTVATAPNSLKCTKLARPLATALGRRARLARLRLISLAERYLPPPVNLVQKGLVIRGPNAKSSDGLVKSLPIRR